MLYEHLKVGATILWHCVSRDADFEQFFALYHIEYDGHNLLMGTITEIGDKDITVEVERLGEKFLRTYTKEFLYDRCISSFIKDDLRDAVEEVKYQERLDKKERQRLAAIQAQKDKTPYSVYHISCERVVLYVGIAKDMQARFKQHLKNDTWIHERVQAGKEVVATEICPAIGILEARQREREWIAHYNAISPLYNRQSKPPDLEQRADWEAERKARKAEQRVQSKAIRRALRERWLEANNTYMETHMQLVMLRKQWEPENKDSNQKEQ